MRAIEAHRVGRGPRSAPLPGVRPGLRGPYLKRYAMVAVMMFAV
jgi:hypothetical protein